MDKVLFTKDNIDNLLFQLAKEYKKINRKNTPAEIVIIGGAAIVSKYGFRASTTDIEYKMAATGMDINELIEKYSLPAPPPEAHYTVYRLTDPEGKIYIGCTGQTVEERWRKGWHYSCKTRIFKAIREFGWENFEKKILCEKFTREGAEKRIKKYTYHKVSIFNKRYGGIIDKQFSADFYKAVVYSIMVYEDFNRPAIARFVERMLFQNSMKPHTYGIMQGTSTKPLTDEESVIKACEKIKEDVMSFLPELECYDENAIFLYSISDKIFSLYNPGDMEYNNQTSQVYENIVAKFYPSMSDKMSRVDLLRF